MHNTTHSLSILAGVTLLVLASSTARAQAIGFDLVPFAGSSSVLPNARRLVSLNLVGGLAGGLDAFEIGGAFNVQTGETRGLQIAGALNVVHAGVRGAQLAGAINLATGELAGVQLSTVNIAGDSVVGAQIGVVNVAGGEVSGLQLGVVNVAPRATAGVGLINVFWDGWADLEAIITETTLTLAGVRHGSDGLYNVYYAGTRIDRPRDLALGFGIGGRWQLMPNLELSVDATTFATAPDGKLEGLHAQFALRPQIAWRIADAFALWAGPTLNLLVTDFDDEALHGPSIATRLGSEDGDVHVFFWPGVTAGVRIF